jgi:hypothetical protein
MVSFSGGSEDAAKYKSRTAAAEGISDVRFGGRNSIA